MEGNELSVVNQVSGLSTKITPAMLAEMKEQRQQLERFVQDQLKDGTDYGLIPGVKEKSLFKAGAEKLASIYQLGSRIIKTDRTIDIEKNFAMYEITVEVFHVPTGRAIAQCTGVTNSQEKKWKERQNYKWVNREKIKDGPPVPTPIGDILNTMAKIAQKRAYVGAIVMATKASDFLTHDLNEDEEMYNEENPGWREKQQAAQNEQLKKAQEATQAAQEKRQQQGFKTAQKEGGAFENFQGGGFKAPPPSDPEQERKATLLKTIASERVRLGWTPQQMGEYVMDNCGKAPNQLSNDEMDILIEALRRTKK